MSLRAAEVEVLITANDKDVARAEKNVKSTGDRIEKKTVTQKVQGDEKEAVESIERVATAAKKLVSQDVVTVVDAKIDQATNRIESVEGRLEYLRAIETDVNVTADIARAEASLSKITRERDALVNARNKLEVTADTSQAEAALDGVADEAGEAGANAGDEFGSSIVTALLSIPIAGAVIGIGVAAGKALIDGLNDGLQVEVGYDRLQALTGIDEASALRLGRQASEAYASGFGESIESNMDTSRLALQFDIIDANTTNREAKRVVEGLAGIADVLDEDVKPVATAVTTLLRTGMAKSADEAFDIIAAGAREGVNRADDLLDTLTEYPALFKRLGLTGPESLGLINQALEGGARNSDLAADALKEFQIRATDASTTSAAGFEAIGLNAEQMTAKIAAGGEGAREGLDQVLDGLRNMEDPVARNAAAVALFGTQAEDLGDALFNMDLSNAVEQLGGVEGAARKMFDVLASNDASKIEQAGRNIEVAMDGIKGALAAGFAEPLAQAADFVSQNRGPVMQFFLDLANGALDFGESMVNAAADSTIALGEFVAGPGAQAVDTLIAIQKAINPFADVSELESLRDGMRDFDDQAKITAETMRGQVGGAIDVMRDKLNSVGEPAVAVAVLNDASLALAGSLGQVGVGADGARLSLAGVDLANLAASDSGRALEAQIMGAASALETELAAAQASGEGQAELTGRYNTTRDALISQIEQMGIGTEQAGALVDQILRTPTTASTTFSSNSPEVRGQVQSLADRIVTLPDGSVRIVANTDAARLGIDRVITDYNGRTIRLNVATDSIYTNSLGGGYHGGVVDFMARGGIPDLTPMGSSASMVPANTWRVVGDRGDVAEAFIPLDGSPRSLAILAEAARRMPGLEGRASQAASVASMSGPRSSGRGVEPMIVNVYDVDNRLIGTMRGEIASADAAAARTMRGRSQRL